MVQCKPKLKLIQILKKYNSSPEKAAPKSYQTVKCIILELMNCFDIESPTTKFRPLVGKTSKNCPSRIIE